MLIHIIAAMSENRVIGREGDLPWRLPADLRRFKALTLGHPVVMGRRTWDTLPGPLPGRTTIVMTRDPGFDPGGDSGGDPGGAAAPTPRVLVARSLDDALRLAPGAEGGDDVFIAGGAEIYRLALPRADRMELTVVHAEVEGDTFFPPFDEAAWTCVHDERHERDERHAHAFSFRRYERAEVSATRPPRSGR